MSVFVIAEAACTWRVGDQLATAERSIKAAKACGADAWKTQWTSDPTEMARRRNVTTDYSRLAWPAEWLPMLKAMCDAAGIEFMVTVYIVKDIAKVAPLVTRFKISAYESQDPAFIVEHMKSAQLGGPWRNHQVIVSVNPEKLVPMHLDASPFVKTLHCISLHPTETEHLCLQDMILNRAGLSDHTLSTISGAVAVGGGAEIIEKHFCLEDTPGDDPDYPHSLREHKGCQDEDLHDCFKAYVDNIREAERML